MSRSSTACTSPCMSSIAFIPSWRLSVMGCSRVRRCRGRPARQPPERRPSDMLLPNQRVEIVQYCRQMQADGLTVGTSGNLSVRSGDHIAITPSGVPYENLTAASICVVDLDGKPVEDGLAPSSEP